MSVGIADPDIRFVHATDRSREGIGLSGDARRRHLIPAHDG